MPLLLTVLPYRACGFFAAFQYHPLIKFEDSNKFANHQNPACFGDGMLAVVI